MANKVHTLLTAIAGVAGFDVVVSQLLFWQLGFLPNELLQYVAIDGYGPKSGPGLAGFESDV